MTPGIVPWEPEETVGKLWHHLAGGPDRTGHHPGAVVRFAEMRSRLALLFRGLGGDPAVELRPVAAEVTHHRRSLRRRLAAPDERVPRASFDGEALRLPAELAVFAARGLNESLYLWLAAAAVHLPAASAPPPEDPLQADLAAIAAAVAMTEATLQAAPGLRPHWARLAAACLDQRPGHLSGAEAAVEARLRAALGGSGGRQPLNALALPARAPRGYRPFLPVALWPLRRAPGLSAPSQADTAAAPGPGPADPGPEGDKAHRARRHRADLAERGDSLILYKFEALLSWAEFLNLNRRVEDDDPDDARKAAGDQEEIGLGQVSKAPATRLKLHLDLAPEEADRDRLAGRFVYPEWDARRGCYLPAHVRVLAAPVEPAPAHTHAFDAAARRRIRAVRRQFEALRPARQLRHAQPDGADLDLDASLRAMADLRATGRGSDRIWQEARPEGRDLAVSILMDVSRSTESAVTGRPVIDIAREALTALALGLDACGDRFAIDGFSSLRRDRVWLHGCKSFAEPMGPAVTARIAALRPGHYTRLGAAVRHVSAGLAGQARARRLLIVLTDGKPNDLDHYEGRHGIEDSAMAVREARRAGQAVFGIAIDRDGQSWFPRLFGRGGFAVIRNPDHLTAALPAIYRQLAA
jgi:nitric oxide reductase NorD protein